MTSYTDRSFSLPSDRMLPTFLRSCRKAVIKVKLLDSLSRVLTSCRALSDKATDRFIPKEADIFSKSPESSLNSVFDLLKRRRKKWWGDGGGVNNLELTYMEVDQSHMMTLHAMQQFKTVKVR